MSNRPRLSWKQIRTLTGANIRSRYRNTVAGLLWVILSPLLVYSAQSYVFSSVLKIQFANYALFLLCGLLPWIFISQSVAMGTTLFVSQGRLLKSFPIHPLGLLISTIADNLVNFSISFCLVLIPAIGLSHGAHLEYFLWLPVTMLSLFIATVGLVWLLATLQVFYYDTKFVVDFLMLIAFYMTPIFYPADFVGAQAKWVVSFNPLAHLLAPIQCLSQSELPGDFLFLLVKSFATALLILLGASLFWRRKSNLAYFNL